MAASFADSTTPPLNPVLWRTLAFDRVAGPRVFQEKECSRAREQVPGDICDDRAGAIGQIHRDERLEPLRAEDQRAEISRSRQVIFNAISGSVFTFRRELLFGINYRHVATALCIWQIQPIACEPFIQKPDTPCVASGRLVAHDFNHGVRPGGGKQPREDGQIESFVLERESKVPIKICTRGMAWRQDAPCIILNDPVMVARCRKFAGQGH